MGWKIGTKMIHERLQPDKDTGMITQSITPAVAYAFKSADDAAAVVSGEKDGTYYGRYGNPTVRTLEKKIAAMEGAEECLGLASGMAAISTALLAFLGNGDHIIVTKDVYGGTYSFLDSLAPRFGIDVSFVDCTDTKNIARAMKQETKAVYMETPSNPRLTILDIEQISAICNEYDVSLIVDNTFMSPYLQNPLACGADIVLHSATKYLNGHGDVLAGFIAGEKTTIETMRKKFMGDLGQQLNAWDAFLIIRGLKTLVLRMRQHCINAQATARFLESHPMIEAVFYPGLESHPQHELAKKQMKRMGGIVSFEVRGGMQASKLFLDKLELAMISFSLGDTETLVQHPASMTHASIPPEKRACFGVTDGLIRLSAGLEEADDIIADLKQALDEVAAQMKILQ
ncbi:trans-sulfuration enzyme family protein [Virgibacillus siamensis]|uniref:trans-sulfuration enzyme family protein n=1 Tax=Virgibacillus siamensis TaxID=480071 RepID=UPI000984F0D2|nr:aminotransferase class I/II-fold pyridoxal phosphate-dependent enzyme [Virgibacillus siamensis]